MVNTKELFSRIQDFYRFDKEELIHLISAILILSFVFSFRDWGEDQFNLTIGLSNFLISLLIVGISLFFRLSAQKIYGLSQGQSARFQIWWLGLLIVLFLTFISAGKITLVLAGGVVTNFMVRQRLGEYRYGFSYFINGVTAFWGIIANLILALIFSLGAYFWSYNYFFTKAIYFNLIMAFCALLPIPQLDGLNIYFGSRFTYLISLIITFVFSILIVSKTRVGLIIALTLGCLTGLFYLIISSDR